MDPHLIALQNAQNSHQNHLFAHLHNVFKEGQHWYWLFISTRWNKLSVFTHTRLHGIELAWHSRVQTGRFSAD